MNPEEVLKIIGEHKIVAIVRTQDAHEAWESALAVIEGGLPVVEVSLTTPRALATIEKLATRTRGVIGAGTVLAVSDVHKVVEAGATFIVTPNLNPDIVSAALTAGLLVGPGVFTATECHQAVELGAHLLKLFPASSAGIPAMNSLSDPFPGAKWLPTGGITLENFTDWLSAGAFAVGMGSALTRGDPERVRARAKMISTSLDNTPYMNGN
jgi:2-dehydro-3-deoxyphosphogluconate aldolase/(4S)-4-hydroxy-2-oxoglutarate aldolase